LDCGQHFTRQDRLDAHRARSHLVAALDAARDQLQVQLELQLECKQKLLDDAHANIVRLQQEKDDLNKELFVQSVLCVSSSDSEDNNKDGESSLPPAKRRRSALVCTCKHFDTARLGEAMRCSETGCRDAFHWSCAGYGRPLTTGAYTLCASCLAKSMLTAEAIEDASNEIIRLDAYLASRNLRREPVPKDGFCLFAAVARGTVRVADDLFQETMITLSTYDFTARDPTVDAAEEIKLRQEAASHATRRLRISGRWDSRLLDFAVLVLIQRFNLICFHANGRTVREDPADHPGAGGRICCYGRGIKREHFDAVVSV